MLAVYFTVYDVSTFSFALKFAYICPLLISFVASILKSTISFIFFVISAFPVNSCSFIVSILLYASIFAVKSVDTLNFSVEFT